MSFSIADVNGKGRWFPESTTVPMQPSHIESGRSELTVVSLAAACFTTVSSLRWFIPHRPRGHHRPRAAAPSCLRDSDMFKRTVSTPSRMFRKAINRKKSLISQSGKHSKENRITDRKENGRCLSRTGALSSNSLR